MSNELGWKFGVEYCWGSSGGRSNFMQHASGIEGEVVPRIEMGDKFSVKRVDGGIARLIELNGKSHEVHLDLQHRLSFAEYSNVVQLDTRPTDYVEALKWYIRVKPDDVELLNPTIMEVVGAYHAALDRAHDLREAIARSKSELAEMDML